MADRKRPHISNIGLFTIDQARGFGAAEMGVDLFTGPKLHFSEKGIFFEINPNQWIAVEHIRHDSSGYYFGSFWDIIVGTYYTATCNYCRHKYENRAPVPCEECNRDAGYFREYIENDPN